MRSDSVPATSAANSGLYQRVWRWHFFAGLLCVPFLLSLAVTGAMYLFHRQIDDVVYARQMLRAAPAANATNAANAAASPALPPTQLMAAALHAHAGQPKAYILPPDARHNVQVDVLRADGATLQVFVDPATGNVAGAVDESERVMTIVKHIHSLAIVGDGGRMLIEIVAGWIVVLAASGVYLWWPRGRRAGVLSIRSTARGRVWWRDLHAVTGAYAGIIVLFLALTGMPWSVFWGANVNAWLSAHDLGVPKGMWSGVPVSTLPAGALGDLPWAQQRQAVPASTDPHAEHKAMAHATAAAHGGAHANASAGASAGAQAAAPATPAYTPLNHPGTVSPDAVVAQLAVLGMDRNYRLSLPRDAAGVYSAIRTPGQLDGQRVIHIDQYSGKVLMLAGCLALIALCLSGVVMWWQRRPAGRLAAPARKHGSQLAKGVLAIAVALGCCFPLLGASMLAVVLLDTLAVAIRRRPL